MAESMHKLIHATINGTTIPFVEAAINPAVEKLVLRNGSYGSPSLVSNQGQKPTKRLMTTAVAATITALGGIRGAVITDDVELFMGAWSGLGLASGSVHKKATIGAGLIVVRSISAPGDRYATITLDIHAITDGTNAPIVITESVAAPTEVLLTEAFFGGPVKFGSTFYEVRGWEYNANPVVTAELQSGSGWPTRVDLESDEPVLSVETTDVNLLADLGLVGGEVDDTYWFLRKAAVASMRVADATEQHVSFRAPKAFAYAGETAGSAPTKLSQGVMVCPRHDGTNNPVVVDVTAAVA